MKIKSFGIFLLFFSLIFGELFALQPITITGRTDFSKSGTLRFYFYNDLYLQQRVLTALAKIEKDGSFKVQIPVNETQRLFVAFNETYGSFFVEPQKSYQIEIYADTLTLPYIDAELMGKSLYIKLLDTDTSELNRKIRRFDRYYNHFFELYGNYFFKGMSVTFFDSIVNQLFTYCPYDTVAVDFYNIYAKYRYAYIDLLFRSKDKYFLYEKYFNNDYIFYKNDSYMDFFNEFFDNYLYTGTKKFTRQMLFEDINQRADYLKLLDDLGKDPLLINEKIREMVLLKGLGELYQSYEEFSRKNILHILQTMSQTTKFSEHKTMITNLLEYLFYLKPGTIAPDFALKDIYNATVKLSDFKGKYVYLQFFATYSEESIREMVILKSLHDKYKDSVQFISVMLDFEPVKLYHFVTTYKQFDWIFVHLDDNFTFLDDYQAKALPLSVFIDKEGKILEYPAISPTQGLIIRLSSLFPEKANETSIKN
ncbi:MAG: TlpA family protein disulfide reductase [Bacteroidales bacterium]|jgi:thiol-disulfide isomerase/thioredoxin|nr:TlpA family protein disulfide reductase [Bacteroidales bacterium]